MLQYITVIVTVGAGETMIQNKSKLRLTETVTGAG
jgi:hypothetical protein